MNLLFKAGMKRMMADFSFTDVSMNSNTLEKQMAGKVEDRSDASVQQILAYREYKKKRELKEQKMSKLKKNTPVMPETLRKDIRRAKTMKQDDIAPTI